MKKIWIMLLALALVLSAAGCKKEEPKIELPEKEESVQIPEVPEEPEEEEPETPTEPEEPEEEKPEEPEEIVFPTQVDTVRREGAVEEVVSYHIYVPKVTLENQTAADAINAYYESVAGKAEDYAWAEAYEMAIEEHTINRVETEFTVEYDDGEILSISRRTVTTSALGQAHTTFASETFDLTNGGLLTADDFFSVPQQDYEPVLIERVKGQIEAGGNMTQPHWEETVQAAFQKTQFYLTPDAYVVYYQETDLDGRVLFPILLDSELGEIFQMP